MLEKTYLFSTLSPDDLAVITRKLQLKRCQPGEILFEKGAVSDAMFFVKSGRIRIFLRNPDGTEITLTQAEANELFGELSLIDQQERAASAIAVEKTDLLMLHRDDFLALLKQHPGIGLALMLSLAQQVRYVLELIEEFRTAQFDNTPAPENHLIRSGAKGITAELLDKLDFS